MNRTQKADEVARIRDRFDRMVNAIVADYRGLDVESLTALRAQFRKVNVEFKVVKNTLVRRAVEDLPFAGDLSKHLAQMTAIAWSYEDPTASAKVIKEFTRTNDRLKVKCGVMEDTVTSAEGWAEMPTREQLLGMIAGQLVAAPQGLIQQMVGPAQQLVSLLDAWKEKLEKGQQGDAE